MFLLSSLTLVAVASAAVLSQNRSPYENAFIIQLSPASDSKTLARDARNHVAIFHKRAASIDYSIRHEFHNSDVFLGLSIQVNGNRTEEEVLQQLQDIEGVVSVSSVYPVRIPVQQGPTVNDPYLSYPEPQSLNSVSSTNTANLGGALQMGGVDKLHRRGIKGKGIKIGVIDTGVDYRHPALGAGFGPGHKIAGGYSFVHDNGTLGDGPDPLISCYGGGHGTHVSGLSSPKVGELGLIHQESLGWTVSLAALISLELPQKHPYTCIGFSIARATQEVIRSWLACQKLMKMALILSACLLVWAWHLSVEPRIP
jgi:Subtilase family